MKRILDNYPFRVPREGDCGWVSEFKEFNITITPTNEDKEINPRVSKIIVKALKEIKAFYEKEK